MATPLGRKRTALTEKPMGGKEMCSISDICDLSSRYFFIHTVPFARLSSILENLLDAGVTPKDILKDVWVFRYNPQSIQSRLDLIKESGILGIKPWMVHCDMKILEM
ncbi:unnamed protein product [Timema podura]|uniref:Uncharacterized protein n=1 Tax=Timema podura TaxID=61482 RepID=A0ABN7P9Q2_TIMPD|nr:unnamed protein product [Timema podura]